MRERAWQVARGRGLSRPPGPSRWWQLPWSWVRPRGLYYLALPVSLATEEGLELVARKAKACGAELVLFDSLTIGSAGAGLSDQNAWNTILSGMEAWGVPCVVIDHMGKTEGRGAVGSFMKQAKVRSALELERKAGRHRGLRAREDQLRPHAAGVADPPRVRALRRGRPRRRPGALRCRGRGRASRWRIGASVARTPGGSAWGTREQLVLDAFRARGGAGATAKTIGQELRQRAGEPGRAPRLRRRQEARGGRGPAGGGEGAHARRGAAGDPLRGRGGAARGGRGRRPGRGPAAPGAATRGEGATG